MNVQRDASAFKGDVERVGADENDVLLDLNIGHVDLGFHLLRVCWPKPLSFKIVVPVLWKKFANDSFVQVRRPLLSLFHRLQSISSLPNIFITQYFHILTLKASLLQTIPLCSGIVWGTAERSRTASTMAEREQVIPEPSLQRSIETVTAKRDQSCLPPDLTR